MKSHFVEVSRLERGVRTETRVLSWSRERRAVRRVVLVVGALFGATLIAVVGAMHVHRANHGDQGGTEQGADHENDPPNGATFSRP